MRVNVHFKPQVADLLIQGIVDRPLVKDVLRVIRDLGLQLVPLHPKSRSKALKGEFVVEVPDGTSADRVITRLNELDATDAVYVVPQDELP